MSSAFIQYSFISLSITQALLPLRQRALVGGTRRCYRHWSLIFISKDQHKVLDVNYIYFKFIYLTTFLKTINKCRRNEDFELSGKWIVEYKDMRYIFFSILFSLSRFLNGLSCFCLFQCPPNPLSWSISSVLKEIWNCVDVRNNDHSKRETVVFFLLLLIFYNFSTNNCGNERFDAVALCTGEHFYLI